MRLMGKLAIGVGCSLLAVNASWGTLTYIQVTALNGVSAITSSAYNDNSVLVVQNIKAQSTWAGAWNANIVSGPSYGSPDPFLGFCTDIANQMPNSPASGYAFEAHLFTDGGFSPNPELAGTPPDPNWANSGSGQRAAWLYNTYAQQSWISGNGNTLALRSAMCLAIWESLYEGSGTFDVTAKVSSGRSFQATGSGLATSVTWNSGSYTVGTLANYWLGQGVSAGFAGYNSTWWAEQQTTSHGDVQSMVGPISAVPEPTTVVAGALLLLPFGLSTLRALRRNKSAA